MNLRRLGISGFMVWPKEACEGSDRERLAAQAVQSLVAQGNSLFQGKESSVVVTLS